MNSKKYKKRVVSFSNYSVRSKNEFEQPRDFVGVCAQYYLHFQIRNWVRVCWPTGTDRGLFLIAPASPYLYTLRC